MPNTVGMISTSLIGSVEFLIDIHRFGPHKVDVSGCSQSLVHLFLAFSECSEVPWRFLLESWSGRVITTLLRRRHLLITSGILTGSLAFLGYNCLVVWQWSLVILKGILVQWSLDLINRRGCSVDQLHFSKVGRNTVVGR